MKSSIIHVVALLVAASVAWPVLSYAGPTDSEIPALYIPSEFDQKRAFIIRLRINDLDQVQVSSVVVSQSPPTGLSYGSSRFRGQYKSGSNTDNVSIPNPLPVRSWVHRKISDDLGGDLGAAFSIEKQHTTIVRRSAEARIVLPFRANAKSFSVFNVESNTLISTVQLEQYAQNYCRSHPAILLCNSEIPTDSDLEEDCIRTPSSQMTVKQVGNRWIISRNNRSSAFSFGTNKAEAYESKRIIDYFAFDETCYVGRPNASMIYLKSNGSVPNLRMTDADCISFNNAALSISQEGTRWLLSSNTSRMKMFPNKDEAQKALKIINDYNLGAQCFVGRPDPSFTYWLAR